MKRVEDLILKIITCNVSSFVITKTSDVRFAVQLSPYAVAEMVTLRNISHNLHLNTLRREGEMSQ